MFCVTGVLGLSSFMGSFQGLLKGFYIEGVLGSA